MTTSNSTRSGPLAAMLAAALLLAATAAPGASAQTDRQSEALARANDLSLAFQLAAKAIAPSVVNIVSTQRIERGGRDGVPDLGDLERFFGRRDTGPRFREARGQGSGVVVREDGYILTNNHVVADATEIQVTLNNGRRYEARLLGADDETDLAVIRIDVSGLEPARFGDSDACEVGQWVLAVGNPFGLDNTVTTGIVSAVGRPAMGLSVYGNFIQTDAAINPGNSGGPLVNLRGEVIGLNNAITTQTGGYMGIGFAIPANMAHSVLDSLIERGTVVRGWLGVTMEELTAERAELLEYEGDGVVITQVTDVSPAAAAGIQVDDILTAIDGRAISTMTQLQNSVARRPPGTPVDMLIYRGGRQRHVQVTLGERPPLNELLAAQNGRQFYGTIGIEVEDFTPQMAERLHIDAKRGVIIASVADDGLADRFGLRPGDVILEFGGHRIDDLADFRDAMDEFNPEDGLRVQLQRGDTTLDVNVQ